VLFLDIQMPELSGLEVAQQADGRAQVVVQSAHGGQGIEQKMRFDLLAQGDQSGVGQLLFGRLSTQAFAAQLLARVDRAAP
jgi:CheY-like chemotaxis protein